MKIDDVLEESVSFNIKKRLSDVYGVSDTGTINQVLDCVADTVEDEKIIDDHKENYEEAEEKYTDLKHDLFLLISDCKTLKFSVEECIEAMEEVYNNAK